MGKTTVAYLHNDKWSELTLTDNMKSSLVVQNNQLNGVVYIRENDTDSPPDDSDIGYLLLPGDTAFLVDVSHLYAKGLSSTATIALSE